MLASQTSAGGRAATCTHHDQLPARPQPPHPGPARVALGDGCVQGRRHQHRIRGMRGSAPHEDTAGDRDGSLAAVSQPAVQRLGWARGMRARCVAVE